MQILISVVINLIILAVVLPLFYIYIVSKARDRLEKETISKAREEIEALVKEFNNIALSRISLLEDAITRANKITKELNTDVKVDIKSETIINKENTNDELKNINEDKLEDNINSQEDIAVNNTVPDNNSHVIVETQKKKLDITVEDENVQTNTIKPAVSNGMNKYAEMKKEEEEKKEVKKINKKNNIDTAAKAIDDKARKEAIERLRSRLDKTIKSKMSIYDKEDKKVSSAEENNSDDASAKNINIIKLYKEGLSKEEIAKKLNCSITEIDIVIDLELE